MPRTSPRSAGATYLDRAKRIEQLRDAASRAKLRLPAIERVILFGSLMTGTPTPRSDADMLVVVEASSQRQPRDRVPELLRALAPLPCPIDVFVLTRDEVEHLRREGSPLVQIALGTGQDLL